ncbi:MAG: histidinol phosphate phosphatase domain-containing protein [Euryarchaeota archaeon]|nr:histidinol phosphate phosphatase domain-containing protein [Euryarchaeota archaeon]
MAFDLHVHSTFSDGELIPAEIARRYAEKGFEAVAITDHADSSNLELILRCLKGIGEELEGHGIRVVPGIELTHLPPEKIPVLAARAKELGAEIVVVHGESPVEPVARGTNAAAVGCEDVDILAHPGFITTEEAELAREHGVYLELTSRRGHCLTNGHIARVAREAGAELLVCTDAHSPEDILTPGELAEVALGAGLSRRYSEIITSVNPKRILGRL